ncbi:MAG: efflux RND transporter periplasmic adaptor subunit [Pseudomonadota bacterium]
MSIEAHQAYAESAPRPAARWHRIVAGLLKALIPMVILAIALPFAWHLWNSGPVAERKARPRVPRLVEVIPVLPANQGPIIEAWGEVVPNRVLSLRPELAGSITAIHPGLTPGGEVSTGEVLVEMDDRARISALAEAEADIAEIEARIAIETGQAARASRDAERSGLNLTDAQRALVLREPQMRQLRAELEAAEAVRDRAALDLSKTRMLAPFNALVLSEEVAPGAAMTAGSEIAQLVSSDRFSVSIAIPANALNWIDPQDGGVVQLSQPGVWPAGQTREGVIRRRGAQISQTGRMVELIVEVEDPLSRLPENAGKPRLLLGSFLRAEIEGRPVENAVALDRGYLRDDDKVWVMTRDKTLEVRPVTVAWRGAEQVLIADGLEAGEQVVTTNLAVSAPGMNLRLAEDEQ